MFHYISYSFCLYIYILVDSAKSITAYVWCTMMRVRWCEQFIFYLVAMVMLYADVGAQSKTRQSGMLCLFVFDFVDQK